MAFFKGGLIVLLGFGCFGIGFCVEKVKNLSRCN